MGLNSSALLLRIFISTTDKYDHKLLYESIVFKAKEEGLSGATVTKGVLGYGSSSVIHSYRFWEITEKLPVVVEIIDEEEKIMKFYKTVEEILQSVPYGCLVTTEKVDVLLYKSGYKRRY